MKVGKDIVDQCIKRDKRAQYELFKICFPVMMRICDRYHKNEADAKNDINESFLKILNKIESFDQNRSFYAWMQQILIRTIIDNFRKKKRNAFINYEDAEMIKGNFETQRISWNEAELQCDADEILELIKLLPAASRKIFNLYAIEGYSHQEIADLLKISAGTSKWHLHNARQKLQTAIYQLKEFKKSPKYV